ncbi:pentatricopeptide repeat-containing protein At4g18520, chloroplastic isoform X2 [Carica papaya]|uniref:pentatricopeptide repeat-containing protein At4g18520, chloroplastic isoform X2 n=1 Tax=Carica papaya TaxID=3649 RepID=UPI000B8CA47C|nr:pentatricopeptide repeat-containing protein At4g18520, chloroplastic isoform X2 [Carica papaya]
MQTLTLFSPQINLLPQFSLFSNQPLQSSNFQSNSNVKRIHSYCKNHTKISSFSSKNKTFECRFKKLTNTHSFQEKTDADFTDTPSVSQCAYSDSLAVWLQSCYSLKEVKRTHAIAVKLFMTPTIYVGNNLISAYTRLGNFIDGRKVFDEMPERNVVTWTAIVNAYMKFGFYDEALRLLGRSLEDSVRPNEKMFVCVLNLCSRRLDFALGRQIHACIVKRNLKNLFVDSAIVYFYAQCGELSSAFCSFNRMPERDVVCWTTMIAACSQQGYSDEVFSMFARMLDDGFSPNEFTACSVLKACGEKKALKLGKQIHGAIIKNVIKNDVFTGTSLVDMYAKCGEILDSRRVFDAMSKRNTVTWTSIIAGYSRKELGEEAISLFRTMKRRHIIVNNLTIVSILRACGSIGALSKGRELHAQIIKNSVQSNIYIGSTLVWLYCKCGEYHIASKVLQQMALRDVVSWTAMISGCANLGHESEALEFLKEMMDEGVKPNSFTYSSALKACANLEDLSAGRLIHSFANKIPALSNVYVGSALIHMYAKCGFVSEAFQVFDSMPEHNLVSWKAMIMGYVRNGLCREALKLLYRMEAEGIKVDDYIHATVLCACGDVERDMESLHEYQLKAEQYY